MRRQCRATVFGLGVVVVAAFDVDVEEAVEFDDLTCGDEVFRTCRGHYLDGGFLELCVGHL